MVAGAAAAEARATARVGFGAALRFWAKLGFISFGGPAGQIAIMHRELVEQRQWISETRFLHALNFCMLLPGPEAQQLATYIGWTLHRVRQLASFGKAVPAMLVERRQLRRDRVVDDDAIAAWTMTK